MLFRFFSPRACRYGRSGNTSFQLWPGAPALTGPAINAAIGTPAGVTTDSAGNVYFTSLNAVYKIDHSGVLTRVAGNAHAGNSGDGGPATSAELNAPAGLTVDSKDNLYIADAGNNEIRRVTPDSSRRLPAVIFRATTVTAARRRKRQ